MRHEFMRNMFRVLTCAASLLTLAVVSHGKEWRGIVPLHSTREDVVRMYGRCSDPRLYCAFSLEHEKVQIFFSGTDESGDNCVERLRPGVVMHVEVTPKSDWLLSELGVDPSGLRKYETSSPPGIGYVGYVDEDGGVIYDTFTGGRVAQIKYIADGKDRRLCPPYYEKLEIFVAKISDPPTLLVECPAEVAAGGRATLSVMIAGADPEVTPKLTWKVNSGEIVSGQGTWSIVIKARDGDARSVKATVEVGGYDFPLAESCEVQITKHGAGKH